MTPETLWTRYAAIWSLSREARAAELVHCLADDVTYCDPNGLIEGQAALSAYIDGFQRSVLQGVFTIDSVLHHHGRTLAHWTLRGGDDQVLHTGASCGFLAQDGRLQTITGFFYPARQLEPVSP